MPVYQLKEINENLKIGVWKLEESLNSLTSMAKDKGINIDHLPISKNINRSLQWLGSRLLISEFYNDFDLSYDQFGKPVLDHPEFISISHTNDYVVISLHRQSECGIDIENVSPKVDRIKNKFLNQNELLNVNVEEDSLNYLTAMWCAKESLFKMYGKKEVIFKTDLIIESVDFASGRIHGAINKDDELKKVVMGIEKIDNFMLVYTF